MQSLPAPEAVRTSGTILCVDDDTTVLSALRMLLIQQLGPGHLVEAAESGEEALELVREMNEDGRQLDVVISDYIMPGMRGDELLVRLHQLSPRTVKIMLTGQSDLEGVKRVINDAHLYRFVEKPFDNDDMVMTSRSALQAVAQERALDQRNAELLALNRDLERLVAERTAQLEEKNRELERMVVTDRLTGLSNRMRLDQALTQEIARCERYPSDFAVLLLDVDHFKAVNDTHGHIAGDAVLVAFGRLLQANSRETDVAGRWGGEEFLIVAPNTSLDGALDMAEKIRSGIEAFAFPTVGRKTASIGVAAYGAGDTVDTIMARADAGLYQAKSQGRNRVGTVRQVST